MPVDRVAINRNRSSSCLECFSNGADRLCSTCLVHSSGLCQGCSNAPHCSACVCVQGKRRYGEYNKQQQQQRQRHHFGDGDDDGEGGFYAAMDGEGDVQMKRSRGPRGGRGQQRRRQQQGEQEHEGYQDEDAAMHDVEVRGMCVLGAVCVYACMLAWLQRANARLASSALVFAAGS